MSKFVVCGLPAKYFIPCAAIILAATYTGTLNSDAIGTVTFLMVVGGVFFWLGNNIPILNNYLGGACLLPLFGASALKLFGLIPEPLLGNIKSFTGGGYVNFYVAAILVGSILCMDRKVLLGATARYLPAILGSQALAVLFLIVGGLVTGTGAANAIFMIGAPTMSGGSSGAITTLPATYSAMSGADMSYLAGPFLCYATIGNVIAVVLAALMNRVGDAIPGFSGNGQILIDKNAKQVEADAQAETTSDLVKIGSGMFLSLTMMVIGNILASVFPVIAGLAWAIVVTIVIKSVGILPQEICDRCTYWMNFMLKNGLPMLIAGIGVNSLNLPDLTTYFSVGALIVIVLGILGALIGAMVFGRLVGLYPMETGVTAGLCCCNIGGSGDIAVLTAANRMNLLAFASISTRIGGALMVVWISLLYPFFMG